MNNIIVTKSTKKSETTDVKTFLYYDECDYRLIK